MTGFFRPARASAKPNTVTISLQRIKFQVVFCISRDTEEGNARGKNLGSSPFSDSGFCPFHVSSNKHPQDSSCLTIQGVAVVQ